MKKLYVLILAGVLTLSLTACGAKKDANSLPQNDENKTPSTSYFGKISSVAGNEIELNLAKEPELPPAESAPEKDGDTMEAAVLTPATTTGDGSGDGAAQRVEVEYTGEMKSFIIPAGMPIKDAQSNEKQLSDIKKGSIMNIFADEKGNVTEVFLYE
ncbi:MAG: hypothetical protein RSB47_01225 [Ruthenibacterium sp.]